MPLATQEGREMSTRFLTGRLPDSGTVWASYDPDALCSAPAVADRRFPAYMAPHASEAEARQALLEAGANSQTIAAEQRKARRRGR